MEIMILFLLLLLVPIQVVCVCHPGYCNSGAVMMEVAVASAAAAGTKAGGVFVHAGHDNGSAVTMDGIQEQLCHMTTVLNQLRAAARLEAAASEASRASVFSRISFPSQHQHQQQQQQQVVAPKVRSRESALPSDSCSCSTNNSRL